MADIDITALDASTTIGGAIFKKLSPSGAGTGQYNTFLAISDNDGNERGFNSDDTNPLDNTNNDIDVSKTHTVLLGTIPVKIIDGVAYYEFHVDLNESNNVPSAQISLDAFQIYTSNNAGIEDLNVLQSQNLAYNMDAGGDVTLLMSDASSSGSGNDDYAVLVPVANFAGQDPATTYLYLYVEMGFKGGDFAVNGTFEEWNIQQAGTLNGTKFSDVNSDGVRDQDGVDNILGNADDEVGVGGVTIFIDDNKNGIFDPLTERSTVTNADGSYSFAGVAVGTHQIDEIVPLGSTQTTGAFETATIASVGQTVVVDPIGNHYPVPNIAIDKAFVNVTDGPDNGSSTTVLDGAGDIANYTIAVTNNGETGLVDVQVTDALADGGVVTEVKNGAFNVGDGNSNAVLDVGETWQYTVQQTALQADLDTNGGGDGDKDNSATVVATQQGVPTKQVTATDTAEAPIAPAPSLAIEKTFVKWADDGANGDAAGDVAQYTVKVTNTGNVTLTNVTVVDPLTGQNISGVTLAPGASQTYDTSYVLTQADLDNNGGGDGDIDNTATADSSETDSVDDSAEAPIAPAPSIDLEKFVSVDGGVTYDDADNADGLQNVNIGAPVSFMITVANTGNVSLTDVNITDINKTGGLPGVPIDLSGVTISESGVANGILDVGETWTLNYTQPFDAGVHLNTATVTTAQGVGDIDDAYYYSLVNEGPGVRTPGFWGNLGFTFWDGIQGNEPKQAGTPGFADGELLYGVDTNGDGVAGGAGDKVGLLVGDYDHDGFTDADEDTLFIELKDAQTLINASNKQMNDGVYKLGRDLVATWLNSLAGNNIGDASDTESPKHYIDDAVDWLQKFAGTTGLEDEAKDVFKFGAAVKTSSSNWNAPVNGIDHSANDMHSALDHYNNDGTTSDGGTVYGHDADSSLFVTALTLAKATPDYFISDNGPGDSSLTIHQTQLFA